MTAGRVLRKKLSAIRSRGYSYPVLSGLSATFETAAEKGAAAVLGSFVEASVRQSRVERVGALVAGLPAQGLFTVLTSPRGDTAMVGLDMALLDHVVDVLAGGGPGMLTGLRERMPTAIDAALCGRLVEAVTDRLAREISALADGAALAPLAPTRTELSPANLHHLLHDQQYLACRVTLELGDDGRGGDLFLAMPLGWVEPAEAALARMRFRGAQADSEQWMRHMRKVVRRSPLRIRAVIDRSRLPVADLTRLEVGRLLPLGDATLDDVVLMLSAGGIAHPVGRGRLGAYRHNKAVRILEPPDPALVGPLADCLSAGEPGEAGPGDGETGRERTAP
jgi:flagellar motor switch protein FliM